jgi:uncharacterized protein YqeY
MTVNFAQIKADQLQARKDKHQVKASLLTTLIGEIQGKIMALNTAERTAKAELETVKSRLTSFIKNNRDAQEQIKDEDRLVVLREEADILKAYLPAQMSEDEIREAVVAQFPELTKKNMGPAIGFLKKKFGDTVDGAVAKQVVESLIVE